LVVNERKRVYSVDGEEEDEALRSSEADDKANHKKCHRSEEEEEESNQVKVNNVNVNEQEETHLYPAHPLTLYVPKEIEDEYKVEHDARCQRCQEYTRAEGKRRGYLIKYVIGNILDEDRIFSFNPEEGKWYLDSTSMSHVHVSAEPMEGARPYVLGPLEPLPDAKRLIMKGEVQARFTNTYSLHGKAPGYFYCILENKTTRAEVQQLITMDELYDL